MRFPILCCVTALLACDSPATEPEIPDLTGQYQGSWRFALRDSAWLENPYGCGFAPCGPPQHRPYVTITCAAALNVTMTGDSVYPHPNTPALAWAGDVTLRDCVETYATEEEQFLSSVPKLPTGLVAVAAATPVAGWYRPEEILGVALRLLNSTASFGEMLGCAADAEERPWHFGARFDELDGAWVIRGAIADGFGEPSFRCGAYLLFLESSFQLERADSVDVD